jgi:hypothetical protein
MVVSLAKDEGIGHGGVAPGSGGRRGRRFGTVTALDTQRSAGTDGFRGRGGCGFDDGAIAGDDEVRVGEEARLVGGDEGKLEEKSSRILEKA